MLSRVRRLRRYVQARGARQTAVAIGRVLRGYVHSDERLLVLLKDLQEILPPRRGGGLRLKDLETGDMAALAELNRKRGRPEIQKLFVRYVEQGFHAFAGYRAGELVGYYWWVDRDVPERYTDSHKLGLGIELDEGDVYGSHFFVIEEHRGGAVAADFLFDIESALRDRGYARIWGYVHSANRPARWLYSSRRYRPMWVVRLRRAFFIQRTARESL